MRMGGVLVVDEPWQAALLEAAADGEARRWLDVLAIEGAQPFADDVVLARLVAGRLVHRERDEAGAEVVRLADGVAAALAWPPTLEVAERWVRHRSIHIYTYKKTEADTLRRLARDVEALPPALVSRLLNVYTTHLRQEDPLAAVRLAERALALVGDAGEDALMVRLIAAALFAELGWSRAALALLDEVLAWPEQAPAVRFRALWLAFTASAELGDRDRAATHAAALEVLSHDPAASPPGMPGLCGGFARWAEGRLAWLDADAARALACWEAAQRVAVVCGVDALRWTSMEGRARALRELGQEARARRLFEIIAQQTREADPALWCASTLEIAWLALARGEVATRPLEQALEVAEAHRLGAARIWARLGLSVQAWLVGQLKEGQARAAEALEISESITSPEAATCACVLALVAHARKDPDAEAPLAGILDDARASDRLVLAWTWHLLRPEDYPRPTRVIGPAHALLHVLARQAEQRAQPQSRLVRLDRTRHRVGVSTGEVHDLSRRPALWRVLCALAEAAAQGPAPVDALALFEAAWPEVRGYPKNGIRRVYTEVYRLRQLGLEVERFGGGYRLAPGQRVLMSGL